MGPFKDELKLIKGWQTRVHMSLSHVPYVGSVGEPDYRQQLIRVSASSFSAAQTFEMFQFTFLARGST